MNKEKRNRLKTAITKLEEAKDIIEEVRIDEEFDFDNLTEGLQATERGQIMEECIDYMDSAIDNIGDAIDNVEDCM